MTTKQLPREPTLLPCPFCGETPDIDGPYTFLMNQGDKWGAVHCCCLGPEVRTGYGPVEEWKEDAIQAWNTRAAPSVTDREKRLVEALREAHMLYREQKLIGTTQECVNWDNKVKRILGEALAEYE